MSEMQTLAGFKMSVKNNVYEDDNLVFYQLKGMAKPKRRAWQKDADRTQGRPKKHGA